MPALRLAHFDVLGLQRQKPRGAVSTRDSEYPVYLVQHVRPAHVESRDGAGAGRGTARRHEAGQAVAAGDGVAGPRLPGRAILGVQPLRAGRPRAHDEPVRLDVLCADGHTRRARDRRRDLALDPVDPGPARQAWARQRAHRRDHRAVLALRGRRLDRDFYRRVPDSVTVVEESDKMATAHAHATTGTYLRIAAILVMITLIEVGVFYVPAFQTVLVPVLLTLSAVKFTLVVMFYMHLKFDNKFFAFLFGGPLLLGIAVVVSLLFIFYGTVRLRTGS